MKYSKCLKITFRKDHSLMKRRFGIKEERNTICFVAKNIINNLPISNLIYRILGYTREFIFVSWNLTFSTLAFLTLHLKVLLL